MWQNDDPQDYATAYLQGNQGLSPAAAQANLKVQGKVGIPATWDVAQARPQATADLLSTEQDTPSSTSAPWSTAGSRTSRRPPRPPRGDG